MEMRGNYFNRSTQRFYHLGFEGAIKVRIVYYKKLIRILGKRVKNDLRPSNNKSKNVQKCDNLSHQLNITYRFSSSRCRYLCKFIKIII